MDQRTQFDLEIATSFEGRATGFAKLAMYLALTLANATANLAGAQGPHETPRDLRWASFRNGGASTVSADANPPTHWSPSEGIAWQVELPGYGQSSPIVVGDRILVTAVQGPIKEQNFVICIDRNSGEEVWRTEEPSSLPAASNYMHSRAAPTPVADRECVYAFFESGDLIAVNLNDGTKAWSCDIKQETGPLKTNHGLGSSLAQTDRLLYLNLEHDGPSALLAIKKSDGSIAWKHERPSGSSWSSPVVIHRGDQHQVVVSSNGEVAGYDAESGKEIWKISDLAGNSVPSPLVDGDQIILGARTPEFGSAATAARSNLSLEFSEGAVEPEIAWRSKRCVADYASPVVCRNNVFLVNGKGILGCLDQQTGEEKYRQRLGMVCWATPIVHDDYVFLFGKYGKTTVLKADDTFSVISENHLWDSSAPPRPVAYVEHYPKAKGQHGGHGGHGGASASTGDGHSKHGHAKSDSHEPKHPDGSHDSGRKPGASMVERMLQKDADADGMLRGEEIPKRLVSVMENIDLNKDGGLDESELKKMAESFAARRKGSRQSSRDPIVYGVAADATGFVIRTGTRLYAIEGSENQ